MTTAIAIPESLQFYFENNANLNAINELVDLNNSSKSQLNGLTLNDLQASNQARLAAIKTQVDFWDFAVELWDRTWGDELRLTWPGLEETGCDDYDEVRDFDYVWDDGFYKMYAISGGYLFLFVAVSDNVARLCFYFNHDKEGYAMTNNMKLSEVWIPECEDDERWTKIKHFPILGGQTTFSVDNLRSECKLVINDLKNLLA